MCRCLDWPINRKLSKGVWSVDHCDYMTLSHCHNTALSQHHIVSSSLYCDWWIDIRCSLSGADDILQRQCHGSPDNSPQAAGRQLCLSVRWLISVAWNPGQYLLTLKINGSTLLIFIFLLLTSASGWLHSVISLPFLVSFHHCYRSSLFFKSCYSIPSLGKNLTN